MRHLLTTASALLLVLFNQAAYSETLTPERIYSSPSLAGETLRSPAISPDGQLITFLKGKQDDYERLDLWAYDIASGKSRMLFDSAELHGGDENLSDEEKARRERLRLKGSGIISYQWSPSGNAILFPLAGDIYYWPLGKKSAEKIIATEAFETDVKFSPKGNYISYVREQNLYVYNIAEKQEIAITQAGGGAVKFGMAEFVAQEEMKRMTGYWWSPDETKIAFTKVDESPVEEVSRSEIYAKEIKTIQQRYPFAGKNNVLIELGIIELKNRKFQWVNLGDNKDIYLARAKWTQNSDVLSYQIQSRDQKELSLKTVTWPSLEQKTILTETSQTWLNLHEDLHYLSAQPQFLWASERDGFKHIYLFNNSGELLKQLTSGDWVIDTIEHVDETNGWVYFTGRMTTPVEKHLYRVSMADGSIEKISRRSGYHEIEFAQKGNAYIDNFSTINSPPQWSLHSNEGKRIAWLAQNKVDADHPLQPYLKNWIKPKFGNIKTDDGTKLYYRLYKPAGFKANKQYPVIVYLYGGPRAQLVTNRWTRLEPQYFAQQGYAVFTIDNRGSYHRGKAFEDPIYRAMGSIEVDDQITGVKFLHTLPWVDKKRIGVHGHSYGGYMTLMAMFKAPEYFSAGVSGAPVTDWRLYDTHYTERYMGTPEQDKEAYEQSSVLTYATGLKGPLLIYHGMADDNVLFKNSTMLYTLLQDNNLPFFVMDYPGKKHSIRGKKTQMHRLNMIRNFFDLHFKR
ncbi:MAG: S9 family peptidase [Gammaproteobacteria bacterium]|nr:S9 family peptidase [Gammaproteobacteria bacterium]